MANCNDGFYAFLDSLAVMELEQFIRALEEKFPLRSAPERISV